MSNREISEIVGVCAGAVSVCWSDIDKAGEFDSSQASKFVDDALAEIQAAGYRKPEVIVEWAAAHASNGVVYNSHRTRDEAQTFVDSMAEVGHAMVIKRREHTPATYTEWETQI